MTVAVVNDKGPVQHTCEDCFYFDYLYDDEDSPMGCTLGLDEDEIAALLAQTRPSCPYYRFQDEYKTVQKQN